MPGKQQQKERKERLDEVMIMKDDVCWVRRKVEDWFWNIWLEEVGRVGLIRMDEAVMAEAVGK